MARKADGVWGRVTLGAGFSTRMVRSSELCGGVGSVLGPGTGWALADMTSKKVLTSGTDGALDWLGAALSEKTSSKTEEASGDCTLDGWSW